MKLNHTSTLIAAIIMLSLMVGCSENPTDSETSSSLSIIASPRSVIFGISYAQSTADEQQITISGSGNGQLANVRVEVMYAPGSQDGWLDADLSGIGQSWQMSLQPDLSQLKHSSYFAHVLVYADNAINSPLEVPINLVWAKPEPKPGLVVYTNDVTLPTEPVAPGSQLSVSGWSVQNSGDSDAEPFDVAIVLSTDQNTSSDDIVLYRSAVNGLALGSDQNLPPADITLPNDLTPGQYYLGFGTDHESQGDDAGRVTNTTWHALTIIGGSHNLVLSANPTSGEAPLEVNFASSWNGAQAPIQYVWNFGDGSSSQMQNPSHTFAAGHYTVRLTGVDNTGQATNRTVTIDVAEPIVPLTCNAAISATSGDAPLAVTFNAAASGGKSPYTFKWDFGDGTSSPIANANHTYAAGTHQARLTVSDSDGNECQKTYTIDVDNSPQELLCSATASPNSGQAPLPVQLSANATGGRPPYQFEWTFGDGQSSDDRNPSHTYRTTGTYQVTMTVTDADFATCSEHLTVTVTPDVEPLYCRSSVGPNSGQAPLNVNFDCTASDGHPPYTYEWNFGDGQSSQSQNTTHVYGQSGVYTVELTVSDSHGETCELTTTVEVGSAPSLQATIAANRTTGVAPLSVQFDANASGGVPPYTYYWDFKDGHNSKVQNPSHQFINAGTYVVELKVVDGRGDAVGDVTTIVVDPSTPDLFGTASANRTNGSAPLAVQFSGSATGGMPPYTYTWKFDDGTTETAQNCSHTFTQVRNYTVSMTVFDSQGDDHTDYITITANQPTPDLMAIANADKTTGVAPLAVQFTGSATGGVPPYTYTWKFDDGTTKTAQNCSHAFTQYRNYNVSLTVFDSQGDDHTDYITINAYQPAEDLVAEASANKTTGDAPLTVQFSGSATGGTPGYSYHWDLGDGFVYHTQNASRHFANAGTYVVTLTVVDANTTVDIDNLTITVNQPTPELVANAGANKTTGDAPLAVQFNGSATGGAPGYSYKWTYGDGTNTTDQNPSHTYTNAGTFTATLTVTDNDGTQATDNLTITVKQPTPELVANAGANKTTGDAPLAVQFSGSATGGVPGYSYKWTYGDGTNSTDQNPNHSYNNPGTYAVAMTVTDNDGNKDTDHLTIWVNPGQSVPASPTSGQAQAISSSKIMLSWNDNSDNETGFKVYVGTAVDNVSQLLVTTGPNENNVEHYGLPAGYTVYYQVFAFNAEGSSTDCAAAHATTLAEANRFTNNTAYPITSLIIDGVEQIQYSHQGIAPHGGWKEIALTAGNHTLQATNGTTGLDMYNWGPVTFSGGFTFENPTIQNLLTKWQGSGSWVGEYWVGTIQHFKQFRFYSNGTFQMYDDNTLVAQGNYGLVSYPGDFKVYFQANGVQGTLYETDSYFKMLNGPDDWQEIHYIHDGQ